MNLNRADIDLFYKLFLGLMLFVNKEKKILEQDIDEGAFMIHPIEQRMMVRDALYQNPQLFDAFIEKNKSNFSQEELDIVSSWKHFKKGTFFLYAHKKNYSIFMDDSKPTKTYGVVAIGNTFDEFFPYPPVIVETTLLPFKNQIIYDGYIGAQNIFFGSGFKRDLKEIYEKSKFTYGIITSLPFNEEGNQDEVAQLKFYLKNEHNRDLYIDEIIALANKNATLKTAYHQEMGRIHSRDCAKQLRGIGLKGWWFALLEGIIIASGRTKMDLEKTVKNMVPEERKGHVYLFQA
jgi:hypothetical protein